MHTQQTDFNRRMIAVAFETGGLFDRLVRGIRTSRGDLGDGGAARYARQLVRHLRANGAFPSDTFEPRCPDCGAVMTKEHGAVSEPIITPVEGAIDRRVRPATFYACTRCEHCEEVGA